jgi:hypothetical protein
MGSAHDFQIFKHLLTARALDAAIPTSLVAEADEVD